MHMGSNDHGLVKSKALVIQAKVVFQLILQHWSGVIIWSVIILHQAWRDTYDVQAHCNTKIPNTTAIVIPKGKSGRLWRMAEVSMCFIYQ